VDPLAGLIQRIAERTVAAQGDVANAPADRFRPPDVFLVHGHTSAQLRAVKEAAMPTWAVTLTDGSGKAMGDRGEDRDPGTWGGGSRLGMSIAHIRRVRKDHEPEQRSGSTEE